MSKEKDLAWLAGFFDGEGCINITCAKGHSGKPQFQGNVWFGQKNLDVMNGAFNIIAIQDELPLPRLGKAISGMVMFEFNSQKGVRFLQCLLPYMRHPWKIRRAEFYIKFFSLDGRLLRDKGKRLELFAEWLELREVTK